MSRVADVQRRIWGVEEFLELTPDSKLLYLWSFTCAWCNTAGLYKVAPRLLRTETGLTPGRLDAALGELRAAQFLYYEEGVIWVRTHVKHLRIKTDRMAKGIRRDVNELNESHPLVRAFLSHHHQTGWLVPHLDGLAIPDGAVPLVEPNAGNSPITHGESLGDSLVKDKVTVNDVDVSFTEWIKDHETVTGMTPPKPGTKARAEVEAAYGARLAEGYSLEELKLATRGAFGDEYRRERGYYSPESVLRPKKVHGLAELGRRGALTVVPGGKVDKTTANVHRLLAQADALEAEGR